MFETLPTPPKSPQASAAAREWADCSGAVLAVLVTQGLAGLEDLPDTLAGDAEAVDLATAAFRVEAWAVAARARAVAQVYARTLAENQLARTARASHGYDDEALTRSQVAAELSLEMSISLTAADAEVRLALLLARHRDLALALATGRIHAGQVRAIATELACVAEPAVRQQVLTSLLADPTDPWGATQVVRELRRPDARLWRLAPAKLTAIIRREVAALDPSSVARRAQRAKASRSVRYYGGPDSQAELVLRGPAAALATVIRRLDAEAAAASASGAEGTLDQLRHDIAVSRLTDGLFGLEVVPPPGHTKPVGAATKVQVPPNRIPHRSSVLVTITVSAPTLAGGSEPAVLHAPDGDSPLPAALARDLAYDPDSAIWRQAVCDPVTGEARSISQTYRPSRALTDFVTFRDGYTSRFPTSTARRRIELDHVVEYDHEDPSQGGPTTPGNLAVEGLREHRLKTDRGFFISGDADGVLTYRTRTGRTYHSWPHQHLRPIPDLELDPRPERRPPPIAAPADFGDPPF